MPQHTWVNAAGGFPDASSSTAFYDAMNTLSRAIAAVNPGYEPPTWAPPVTGTPVTAEWLNDLEGRANTASAVLYAPAPSGGDDTAVLQPLWAQAQASRGTLVLQAGTYKANLATAQFFGQPRLVGQGKDATTLQGYANTAPVLRFKGGSGAVSGGYFGQMTIKGTGGVGVELADCGGVTWSEVRFTGTLDEGIRFHSESTNAFCEFNAGAADIDQTVVTAVRYKRTSGNESFHGSGLTGGVINTGGGPAILIDAGCFPYNAPLSATVFTHTTNATVIANNSGGRTASFFGHLRLESWTSTVVGAESGQVVYYAGQVTALAGPARLGKLYLVDKVYFEGSGVFAQLRPFQRTTTLAAGTVNVLPDRPGSCWVRIDLVAANYHYAYTLDCWQSPYDPGGTVTVIASPKVLNTAQLGAPTFAWSNYGLQVTNPKYSSAVTAFVTVLPLTGLITADRLAQY